MHFSNAVVLTALAAGSASASQLGKAHNHAARHVEIMKAHHEHRRHDRRDVAGALTTLSASATSLLNKLGALPAAANPGANAPYAVDSTAGTPSCAFSNEFINQSEDDVILTIWGPAGSWVNAVAPQVTHEIPSNGTQTFCFPNGWSGAWAPIYPNTTMVNGQISDTWGEGTFAPPYSVVDVSREVNMQGRPMAIHGPSCISDMDTCVFKCDSGNVCLTGYSLVNCATGSQPGANFGTYEGAASGGCGGMGQSAHLTTYLG